MPGPSFATDTSEVQLKNNFSSYESEPSSSGQLPKVKISGTTADLELKEKAIAAAASAFLSAVIVNPLDVAKTRLQAQAADLTYLRHQSTVAYIPKPLEYRGTWDVFFKVSRQEGFFRLWRGTNAALLLAVPSVGIYLPIYDILKEQLEEIPEASPYSPLIAGSFSRSLAVICCSPLELARTRMQAHRVDRVNPPGIGAILRGVWNTAREGPYSNLGRIRSLWSGVGAHLARDVPFSAICWTSMEPIRRHFLSFSGPEAELGQILVANFGAGLISGALAAGLTTPLDVAKTRRQIEVDPIKGGKMSTIGTLLSIYRNEGRKGLFTGVIPRVGRAAPSVAMVVSFYEIMKHTIKKVEH